MKTCLCCNEYFTSKDYRTKFCSKSCSATFNNKKRGARSIATKEKISKSLSGRILKIYTPEKVKKIKDKFVEFRNCEQCNIEFKLNRLNPYKKTCSKSCSTQLKIFTRKNNLTKGIISRGGGMREGSGRGKSGHYKGFYLNSTYELAYVIYHIDHNLNIKRNIKGYSYFDPDRNKYFKFYPDFITDDELVEIKGYKTKLTSYKLTGVSEPIKVLYKEDLKEIFEYVKISTGLPIERLYELYESHKPKYTKICKCCYIEFTTERKSKILCSIICSGKMVAAKGRASKVENRIGLEPIVRR